MRFDVVHVCLLVGVVALAGVVLFLLTRGNKEKLQLTPPQLNPPPPARDEQQPPSDDEIILFHSHSCGHCINMMPAWKEFVNVARGHIKVQELTGADAAKHGIRGFPTIRYYPRGSQSPKEFVEYKGDRSTASFLKFAASKGKEM